jgi:hypothetical protein
MRIGAGDRVFSNLVVLSSRGSDHSASGSAGRTTSVCPGASSADSWARVRVAPAPVAAGLGQRVGERRAGAGLLGDQTEFDREASRDGVGVGLGHEPRPPGEIDRARIEGDDTRGRSHGRRVRVIWSLDQAHVRRGLAHPAALRRPAADDAFTQTAEVGFVDREHANPAPAPRVMPSGSSGPASALGRRVAVSSASAMVSSRSSSASQTRISSPAWASE